MVQTVNLGSPPDDYGDIHDEYRAIRHGVALLDFSSSGKLQLTGKNAVQFLNGLVSNEVKDLAAGHGVPAAFPTLQGKLLALCRIYNTGDYLLIELDAINREKIFKNLSRFVPAGEFFVADVSDRYALISLQGPRSKEFLENLTGSPMTEAPPYSIHHREIGGSELLIATHSRCGETGFDLFAPIETAKNLWETLLTRGEAFGARPAGQTAFEIARIEAGVPREGIDAGEEYIILESELNDAVSYTKGCYLGQEVIARIHWRGQPAKRLRGLLIDADRPPARGTLLFSTDGKKVGEVTSSVQSIALERIVALAYVHRNYLNPGTEFTLRQEESETGRAQLVDLPFIRE